MNAVGINSILNISILHSKASLVNEYIINESADVYASKTIENFHVKTGTLATLSLTLKLIS